MRNSVKISILFLIALALSGLYLFHDLNGGFDYILPRRGVKLLAMVFTAIAIAYATVIFQTITHNRILTPSIMGLDSLYLLIQTIIIFFFGSSHFIVTNKHLNFLLSVGAMVAFALLLYQLLFKKGEQKIYFLLLIGIIVGTLFESMGTFLQVLIDPNEFLTVQDRMFASFNNVNNELVSLSMILIIAVVLFNWRSNKYLDVLSLGRDTAMNLGVAYDQVVKKMLIIVAVLIAIATGLVGPITFFGLIVANLSYQFFSTYKHDTLIIGAVMISVIALVGGQWLVERIFTFSTTLSVIVNFFGGVYFIYLLLKESRSS